MFAAEDVFLLCSYKVQGSGAQAARQCKRNQPALGWEAELLLSWQRGELGGKEPGKPEHAVDIFLISFKGGKTAF